MIIDQRLKIVHIPPRRNDVRQLIRSIIELDLILILRIGSLRLHLNTDAWILTHILINQLLLNQPLPGLPIRIVRKKGQRHPLSFAFRSKSVLLPNLPELHSLMLAAA
ncbi:hypothetical protein D3C87_1382320 [compost metagenome]